MKRLALTIILFALVSTCGTPGFATPVVSAIQGTFGNQQAVTIVGAGFGLKSPAAPYLWADFESSLDPSQGGVKTSWDEIQSMTWVKGEGYAGSNGAMASDGSGDWSLRTDYDAWTRDGQTLYIHKKERVNFLITDPSQNWKVWRMWTSSNGYPDVYAAENNGRVFVENVSSVDSGFYGSFAINTTNWITNEIIFRASTIDQKDGYMLMRYDGKTVAEGSMLTRSSSAPDYMTMNYVVHAVLANVSLWSPAWSSNNRIWVDDVYVDTTWSRVMIGDAANYAACTHLEIQIPTAWSQNSVSIIAHTGTFSSGTHVYLYVFDNGNLVNAVGLPVTIGQSGNAVPGKPVISGPVANAGPDVVAAVKSDVILKGSVTANGAGSNLVVQWSLVSGPGTVTFTDTLSATTMAQFSAPGQYVLQLEASDGTTKSVDTVSVQVVPPVGPTGVPPKNVFNPATGETFRILYEMSSPGHLDAQILDRNGRLVRALDGGDRPAGEQYLEWDGRNDTGETVASGIYVVLKRFDGQHAVTKVAVIK